MFMGPITWRQVLFSVKPPTALLRAPCSAGLGLPLSLEGSLAVLEGKPQATVLSEDQNTNLKNAICT